MPDLPSLFGQLPRVRTWSRLGLCVLAGLLGLIDLRATGRASAGDRPNVLFIAVDDLRPEFGAYGAPHVHSPHLDRLARSGVTFLRAYCQQAVCSPSRSSVLTGARPDTTRVYDLNTHFRTALPQVVTLGEHFKNHGYFVQGVGKIYHPGFDDTPTWSVPWHTPTAPTYALPESEPASNEPASNEPAGSEPAGNEPAGQKNDPDQPAGPSDAGAPTGAPPAADPAPQAGSPAQPRRAGPPGRARRRRAANAASPQQSANTPTANTPTANTPGANT
ncbi:MAG: sulfatase-like hydrolase/transferase, partial [Planctomycetaceae bacterium]